jgi:hypothetical protein
MKKIVLIAIAGIFTWSIALAQMDQEPQKMMNQESQKINSADVPANITNAFAKSHPKVTDAYWYKTGDNYTATYMVEQTTKTCTYGPDGKLIQTGLQLGVSELPIEILKYVNENFKKNIVRKSMKITTAKGKVSYIVQLNDRELNFDSKGNIVNS